MSDSTPISLLTPALEGSTYQITVSARNSAGQAVTPTSASYSLYSPDGAVINSRLNVAFPVLGSDVVLTLVGADLELSGASSAEQRVMVVKMVADTPQVSGCTFYQEILFTIRRRVGG